MIRMKALKMIRMKALKMTRMKALKMIRMKALKMIRRKALNLYSKFSGGDEGEPQPGPSSASDAEELQASKGWLDWFVKWYQLRIGKSHGEATSADTKATEKYPEIFNKLIKENGFKPEHLFNMDETGFCS